MCLHWVVFERVEVSLELGRWRWNQMQGLEGEGAATAGRSDHFLVIAHSVTEMVIGDWGVVGLRGEVVEW